MPERSPPEERPGTLTGLLDEVFRGSGAERSAWVEDLSPGTALGRYDLIREVGRGGSGVVWEARDRELGRRVALKVIRTRSESRPEMRLVAEAEVAARLSHPGIVTILDVGRNDKGAWLVQEFLVGRTLAARLAEGALPLREALVVATKVASAIAHAHRHGVTHRDLTPSNVFLCEDGQVKVLDLGMAQAFGRRKLEGGTPDYMAPEQALGEPEDERVDVYALGVLLFRMLSGRSPFPEGPPPEKRLPPHLVVPELPGLGDLVDRMLAPVPRERPRDAVQVLAELEALGATLPRASTTTSPGVVRTRRRWSRWSVLVAGVVGGALLAGAGTIAVLGGRPGAPPARGPVASGAVATSNLCNWGRATWIELDRVPEGAIVRNGELGGQGVAEVAGRKAWLITSDWAQIFFPLGNAASGDSFAVEAEFYISADGDWERGAEMGVFTEVSGELKSGTIDHGIVFLVKESPGKAPFFMWFEPEGTGNRNLYVGTLPGSIAGRWHTLRIEGSRTRKWFRGLLDGRPLVVAHGDYDLAGSRVFLGAGYGDTKPENVAWSNLRTFAGKAECQ